MTGTRYSIEELRIALETDFGGYVPASVLALVEAVQAAEELRIAEAHTEHVPMWRDEARRQLDEALDRFDFTQPTKGTP